MKAPLLLGLCVAILELAARAQDAKPSATNTAALGTDVETLMLPLRSRPAEYQAATVQHQEPVIADSPSMREALTAPRWETPIPEEPLRLGLGQRNVPVRGFLVNVFGPAPQTDEARPWIDRALGWKRTSLPTMEFAPRPKRDLRYFKWGDRDEPWNAVAFQAREREGVLFSLHF